MAKRRRTNFPIRTAKPPPPPRVPLTERLADWFGRWPRALRMLLNLIIAAGLTGVVGLGLFSLLYRLPPDDLPTNTTTIVLVVLTILGLVLYWVGWRVLIGFNWDATNPHKPGCAALLWILFALLVFIATAAIAIASVIDASKET